MLSEELVQLIQSLRQQKAESRTIEVKAAHDGCPQKLYGTLSSFSNQDSVGDADLPMTDYELYSYEAFRRRLHDDERPVERATLQMLDQNQLHRYLSQKRFERPGFSQLSEAQAYEMLNITRGGALTLAAVMTFGLYPQGFFPQLAITAVVVPGTRIGDVDARRARFIDNKGSKGLCPPWRKKLSLSAAAT